MAQPVTVKLDNVPAPAARQQVAHRHRGLVRTFIARNPVGAIGFALLLFFVLLAIFGPIIVSADNPTNVQAIYAPPSREHPLGTDYMGKDVLEQVIRGGRSIMVVGVLAALLTTFIGVVLGALSAIIGGRFDTAMLVLSDIVLTVPAIILLSVLAAYVSLRRPTLLRAVRAQVLSLKEREYVEAARMLDLGTPRILFREVIPNMMSYILINFIFAMTAAIYAQIFLYFLGLVPLTGDNWGLIIQQAYTKGALFFKDSLLYILSPIVMICLLQLSLVMVSRSLEDIF